MVKNKRVPSKLNLNFSLPLHQKKAQLTLFIIMGVLIVVGISIAVFLTIDSSLLIPQSKEPHLNFQSCVEDSVQSTMITLLENGGVLNPPHYIPYKSHNYTYLCFTADYYSRCYNYYPIMEHLVENQIRENTAQAVKDCFASVVEDAERGGMTVTQKPENYSVDLLPGKLKLNIEKEITMESESTTETFRNFGFEIPTKFYELTQITTEIVNYEGQYCYFDVNNFMIMYPKYSLTRFDYKDSKIYTVKDRDTQETLKFAIRSCPFAPGV